MRTELYTLVVAGTMLLGGCAQMLGIEDLPPLVDAASPGGIDLARGLVGHWPLDAIEPGGSGDITGDASGNGFDGKVNGAGAVAGRMGMALRFDGNDDSVRIRNRPELDFTGAVTLSAWCRPAIVDGRIRNIVAHGSTGDPQREVFLRIDHEDQYEGGSWDGLDHKAAVPIPVNDRVGGWVHLAAVYDGQAWVLYRNGMEVGREPASIGAVTVDEDWFIGARGSHADRFFQGDIDDVRIYSRALLADEVAALAAP